MANAIIYGIIGFAAGVIFGNSVRTMLGQLNLPFEIPSFRARAYPSYSYPVYDTTRSSFAGSVTEKEYDNNLETHINHIPMD